jgi:hypothetical protein
MLLGRHPNKGYAFYADADLFWGAPLVAYDERNIYLAARGDIKSIFLHGYFYCG